MDILKQLNDVVDYIENHLTDEIDMKQLAKIALYSTESFTRFFSYTTGMTVKQYIRRRRLTLAAYDLIDCKITAVDAAYKYGYNNVDAFSKAFLNQHGITPNEVKKSNKEISVFPPAFFKIQLDGAKEMKLTVAEQPEIVVYGLSKKFTGCAADRFEQEHIMWADHHDNIQNMVSVTIPGVWYGIWNNGQYTIAKDLKSDEKNKLDKIVIPSGRYAIFKTGNGGFAGEELPKLRTQIFESWLPDSGYIQSFDFEVEVYYLYQKNQKNLRHYKIMIPIK